MVKKTIELNANEIYYLTLVLSSEIETYENRVAHAASHGDMYQNVRGPVLTSVLEKLGVSPQ